MLSSDWSSVPASQHTELLTEDGNTYLSMKSALKTGSLSLIHIVPPPMDTDYGPGSDGITDYTDGNTDYGPGNDLSLIHI